MSSWNNWPQSAECPADDGFPDALLTARPGQGIPVDPLVVPLPADWAADDEGPAGAIADFDEQQRWRRMLTALGDLRDGYEFALNLGREAWDFAVEIDELQRRGLRTNDLRWLIFKGWVAHAHENKLASSHQRCFTLGGPGRFDESSCFVLTAQGADAIAGRGGLRFNTLLTSGQVLAEPAVPLWDPQRQELRLANSLIKRFKVPAYTQGIVLSAFEEERWPARIDDPLPGHPEQDRKRRLHNTINALNRNQINHLVRFCGDGRGLGIRWELTSRRGA